MYNKIVKQRYFYILGVIIAGLVLGLLCVQFGMAAEVAATLVGGVYTFASIEMYSAHKDDEKPKKEIAAEIKKQRYRHPFLVFLSALAILEVAWNVCSFLLGVVVGMTLGPYAPHFQEEYLAAINTVSLVVMVFTIIPIAIYVSHRVRAYALLWLLALLVVNQVLLIMQTGLILHSITWADAETVFLSSLMMIAWLMPGVIGGYFLAKKTQQKFILTQLFTRLNQADKKALLELMDALPTFSKAK
jgi:uncharacterized protein YneF (UPF0154 family)